MLYVAGEHVCISGVYQVVHLGHRPPHEVWVRAEETFPHCHSCGDKVIFKFMGRATEQLCEHISSDRDFQPSKVR